MKADKAGKLQWQRTFAASGFDTVQEEAYSLVQTTEEGYLLIGSTSAEELTGVPMKVSAGLVVKFTKDGRFLWHKTYGELQKGSTNSLHRIVPVKDGYVLAGITTISLTGQPTPSGRYGVRCLWLLKIDAEGNLLWEKIFKDVNAPPADVDFSHLLADEEGNVVLALTGNRIVPKSARLQHLEQLGFAPPAEKMLVLGFDKNGNKTSHVVLPESSMGNINLTATRDGYLASGYKEETKKMWFAWLDKTVAFKEHKVVDTKGVSLTFLVPTNDGGFYGAGSTPSGSGRKAAVGQFDKDGQVVNVSTTSLSENWWIWNVVAGADEHRFVTLWQAFAQKRAVLLEVIHKPGKGQ